MGLGSVVGDAQVRLVSPNPKFQGHHVISHHVDLRLFLHSTSLSWDLYLLAFLFPPKEAPTRVHLLLLKKKRKRHKGKKFWCLLPRLRTRPTNSVLFGLTIFRPLQSFGRVGAGRPFHHVGFGNQTCIKSILSFWHKRVRINENLNCVD